jgi:LacI family gluconate utilization system Gnt-I transcriptional repressor
MRMRDIAQALGISSMTVSRALKADASVAPATRQAILKAISDLGYVPNQIAGSLSSNRSGFVAILVPSLNNPHFSATVLGLNARLAASNIQLLIGSSDYDRDTEEALVRAFLARKPEAVILTSDGHTAGVERLLARAKVPVVEIWDTPDRPIQHVVGFSNRSAMKDLITLMIDRGYRRITYLGELDDEGTRGSARRQGYLDALAEKGMIEPRLCSIGHPPATMSDGQTALDVVLTQYPDTDLVVCVSDPLAFGVISACQRRGIKVPEQLAVAGFGDFEIARVAVPDITTVMIDASEIGSLAADLILGLLSEPLDKRKLPRIVKSVSAAPILRGSAPGKS